MDTLTAPGRRKYSTDEQRRAARRRTYRENARKQQELYYEICGRFGIPGQGRRWASHLAEIRHLITIPPDNLALWRQYRNRPYVRWWLERYTLDEIRRLADGMHA